MTDDAADAEAPTGSRDRFATLWDRVEEDLAATAEEYREAGWDVTTLDVGDVTPLPSTRPNADRDRVGLDALVPGTQFDALRETVDDHSFDEYETYRAAAGDVTFLVLVMRDTDAGLAVMLPLFYVQDEAEAWLETAREDGETNTYVRPLTDDERVVFHHEDPEPFFPPEADAADGDAETGA